MQRNNNNNQTWNEARQAFGAAVTNAVEELLQQGFSRERATAAVLRQITGGHDKPSDNDVSVLLVVFSRYD